MKYTAESPNLKAVHGDMTGKQRVRRTGRVALTCVNWLCSTGGSAQCTVLTREAWGGSRAWEGRAISIHGADSSHVVPQKLTQHCTSIILNKKAEQMMVSFFHALTPPEASK